MKKAAVILVGVVVPAILFYFLYKAYSAVFEPGVVAEHAPFDLFVEEGTSLEQVYTQLYDAQVLQTPEALLVVGDKKGLTQVRSGHYIIEEGMSINGIVNMFKAGLQQPVKVSFNAGEHLGDIASQLSKQLMTDSASLYDALAAPRVGWEGPMALGAYLPDTYEFYWNASAEQVAERMFQNTLLFWNEARLSQASELGLTPSQVCTLASVVMKESSHSEDRKMVAGLYLNRLNLGMKLQSDPTVIFALNQSRKGPRIQRVWTKDLTIEHPYNTYVNTGLPPGPICVPEKQALLAVLNSKKHDYIFMCANPDTPGTHAYATEYNEHLRNRERWKNYLDSRKIYR